MDDIIYGSGNDSIINSTFNCRNSTLSTTGITDNEHWSLRADIGSGSIAIAFFESIIFIIAITWNLFIFITYIIKYRLLKEPANILLFSLSITDILICIFIIPFPIIVAAASGEYIIGNSDVVRCDICSAQGYLFVLLTDVSLHLLAILSIDRCILLSNPLKYKDYKKIWTTVVGVLVVWVLCSILAVPPAFGFGEWEFNQIFGLCLPRWTPLRNSLYMLVLMVEGLIPIIVLAVTNVWTFKIVNRFLKRNLERKKSFRSTKEEVAVEKSTHRNQQNQLVKVFGALFIVNILSWTPLLLVTFATAATDGEGIPDWIYIVSWFFLLLNPTVHPIIESFFIKELRTRVNRAQKSVRKQVRRASRSILKMATLDSFKDIPTMTDEDESEKSRRIFKRKSTSQSLGGSSIATSYTDPSPPESPMTITRANTLTNSGRFPDRESRTPSPLLTKESVSGTDIRVPSSPHRSSPTPLPCINEDSQLDTSDIEKANRSTKTKSTSSIADSAAKKKKRHISITVPGEKDIYRAETRATTSRSPSPSSSNDSAIMSGPENEEPSPVPINNNDSIVKEDDGIPSNSNGVITNNDTNNQVAINMDSVQGENGHPKFEESEV